MRKRFLWFASALAIACSVAWSQQLVPFNYTGNESWVVSVGGVQGQSGFITMNVVRNTEGTSTAAAAATVNTSASILYKNYVATGSVSTWNFTLPNPAYDGEVVTVGAGGGSTIATLSLAATGSPQAQTINTGSVSTTVQPTSGVELVFNFATLTWFRIR